MCLHGEALQARKLACKKESLQAMRPDPAAGHRPVGHPERDTSGQRLAPPCLSGDRDGFRGDFSRLHSCWHVEQAGVLELHGYVQQVRVVQQMPLLVHT